MMKLKGLFGKASNAINMVPGVFWYKVGLIAALLTAYTIGVAGWATHRCELKHERQKTEQAEQHTKTVIHEVQTRVPVVQKVEVESAKQRAEIVKLKRELDDALKNRPENPSCDLSVDEFNGVSALARKTHTTK